MPAWDRAETPRTLTKPHRQLHALLTEMGFGVEDEVRVGVYSLDCYVRDLHLGFEADGPTHRTPKGRASDSKRDTWLIDEAGIPLFRASDDMLSRQRTRAELSGLILEFIERWATTIDCRYSLCLTNVGNI